MPDSAPVRAPEFPSGLPWLNADKPLKLAKELRGRVVLLDFWTYCCINCLHTLPELEHIERHFAGQPVTVIGVHSPKFDGERDPERVAAALERHGVHHPVIVDNDHAIWQSYTIQAWPTLVLVDAEGKIRAELRGENDAQSVIDQIDALLAERGDREASKEIAVEVTPNRSASELRYPGKVAADHNYLYIADSGNHRIVVCTHEGEVVRVVGGMEAGAQDGRFDTASFCEPQGMSSNGEQLFVADRGNHLLRCIDLDLFWVKTLAGNGELGQSRGVADPSQPTAAALRSPWDVQVIGNHVLIAMAGCHQIWLYDLENNEIGAWAGTGAEDHVDGTLQECSFAQPSGLDLVGPYLMIADAEVSSLRAVDLHEGEAQTLVGGGLFDFGDVDGGPEEAMYQHPLDVAAIGETMYVADTFNNKIRAIDLPTLTTRTIVGDGSTSILFEPGGLCAVGEKLLVADTNHHRLVWIDPESGELTELELTKLD